MVLDPLVSYILGIVSHWYVSQLLSLSSEHLLNNQLSNPRDRPPPPYSVNHMPLSLASLDPQILSRGMNPSSSADVPKPCEVFGIR